MQTPGPVVSVRRSVTALTMTARPPSSRCRRRSHRQRTQYDNVPPLRRAERARNCDAPHDATHKKSKPRTHLARTPPPPHSMGARWKRDTRSTKRPPTRGLNKGGKTRSRRSLSDPTTNHNVRPSQPTPPAPPHGPSHCLPSVPGGM